MIKKAAIIGYGKFGKVVDTVLQKTDYTIDIFDPHVEDERINTSLEQTLLDAEIIIISVPLEHFESSIKNIAQHITSGQTIIEVCSTNIYPKEIMLKYLPEDIHIIGSHPMFGPQTLAFNNDCLDGFNIVIENIRCGHEVYDTLCTFLNNQNCNVIEMTADEHDKRAAKFHFLAQLVGNSLVPLQLEQTNIDTVSYEFLFNFMKRLDPDPELLQMMYTYNPYSKKYLAEYKQSFENIYNTLT